MYNENRGMDGFQNIVIVRGQVPNITILQHHRYKYMHNMYKDLYIIIYYSRPGEKN